MQDQTLYAFWKYDQFPYVLGGTVTKMNGDGSVQIKEYGNSSFNPVKILPLEDGKKMQNALYVLQSKRDKALKEVNTTFNALLRDNFPFCL